MGVVYGPENGCIFPYSRLERVNTDDFRIMGILVAISCWFLDMYKGPFKKLRNDLGGRGVW